MCAKFGGDWDNNDLNMDLKMSAGPVFCYGGTPKFAQSLDTDVQRPFYSVATVALLPY